MEPEGRAEELDAGPLELSVHVRRTTLSVLGSIQLHPVDNVELRARLELPPLFGVGSQLAITLRTRVHLLVFVEPASP
jgi:hypothetical protein